MKKMLKDILIVIGTMIAIFLLFIVYIIYAMNFKKTTIDTLQSSDGQYKLVLQEVGEPFLFGPASGRLILKERRKTISKTETLVYNDGGRIHANSWQVTWYEDYVEAILSGEEQPDEQVLLYFDGTVKKQTLWEEEDDYGTQQEVVTGELLDESRVIGEEPFGIRSQNWKELQFVSYLPSYDKPMEDVSFVLAKQNRIQYRFPEFFAENSLEHEEIGQFESVEDVGFWDIDSDGLDEVIVMINYAAEAEGGEKIGQKHVRIFQLQGDEFVIRRDWMEEVTKNVKPEKLSVTSAGEYAMLIETGSVYEGYCAIKQKYYAEEDCEFTLSYDAKGHSEVILKETEESVEYLVYDRPSKNNKCELYVLYRCKKRENGTWDTSDIEILDIFAYKISAKEIISSGKTYWEEPGSDAYCKATGEK